MKNFKFGCAILVLLGAMGAAVPSFPPSGALAQGAPGAGEKSLVASIQELLTTLGYNAGTPDGLVGQRTRAAIVAFQKQANLPADGLPTEALYHQLTLALNQGPAGTNRPTPARSDPPPNLPVALPAPAAASSAAVRLDPSPRTDAPTDAAMPAAALPARWRIVDAGGGSIDLSLESGGRVGGVATTQFWRWEWAGNKVRIVYDNGWGGRVVREGRLAGQMLVGNATGPGGRSWNWRAAPLPAATAPSAFDRPRK